MKTNNRLKSWIIFGVYIAATCALLIFGYSVQAPAVKQQEFPFTVTYYYKGKTETISDVYVSEYVRTAKYIGDDSLAWFGYVKGKDRLEPDYYTSAQTDEQAFSINLNIEPGYLMGDPNDAASVCEPGTQFNSCADEEYITITDAAQLEQMGFYIVSWEYPAPIDNTFSFSGISLSSEGVMYTAAIAVAALLACVIFIRRDKTLEYGVLDKVSVVLNFLIVIFVFPFILISSALTEIVADASAMQQLLYLAPALTAIGIAASVTLRRMRCKQISFWVQFAGPIVFSLILLLEAL